MHSYYALLALDLANERAREAEEQWRSRMLLAGLPDRPSFVRRTSFELRALFAPVFPLFFVPFVSLWLFFGDLTA